MSVRRNEMKDKEFDAKLIAYLLGKEELFDEVVDELAEKIKKELDETDDIDETDDWDEYYKQEDYDYNHERGEENYDDEEEE